MFLLFYTLFSLNNTKPTNINVHTPRNQYELATTQMNRATSEKYEQFSTSL